MKEVAMHALSVLKLSMHDERTIDDIIKIKRRDSKNPNFRNITVRDLFEKKIASNHTLSSIHGVKGETYDALLLKIESITGNTLTPSFLNTGDLSVELMRIAYVAMTRPRNLLVVAMPNTNRKEYERFPKDKWIFEYI